MGYVIMKNIVQLYFDNKKIVPFIVRRGNWSKNFGMLITSVKPKRKPSGWYGEVYGYPLPPSDGSKGNPYWGKTGKPQIVKNAGSYQWEIVDAIPEVWKPHLEI